MASTTPAPNRKVLLEAARALDGVPTALVSDALDRLGHRGRALEPSIRPMSAGARLSGLALPVVFDPTSAPRSDYENEILAIEAIQPGDIIVIETGIGNVAATWGELFSCAARGAGALGVVTDGYIRDVDAIETLGFPVFARGASPLDTLGRADVTSFGFKAVCAGVAIYTGDIIVGDRDGLVAVPAADAPLVSTLLREKQAKERDGRRDLLAGVTIREVWDRYGVF